jgi:glycosyltransferase involved in cell wall biosynthesis
MDISRQALGIPLDSAVFVASGRIGHFKGWQLLLDAFAVFHQKHARSLLFFVGDGEDRPLLDAAVASRGMGAFVKVTGFCAPSRVAAYLNAADAVVVGSLAEGWSVAMLEALACGKPIVTTPVSGAGEMIVPGKNGFIVQSRDPDDFAGAMEKAPLLIDASALSVAIAQQFSLSRMRERLAELWFPLRTEGPERLPIPEIAEAVKQ